VRKRTQTWGWTLAQAAEHLKSVDVGQGDVEDDGVRRELRSHTERRPAVERPSRLPPLALEHGGEHLGQRSLVVDDENPQLRPVGAQHRRRRVLGARGHEDSMRPGAGSEPLRSL